LHCQPASTTAGLLSGLDDASTPSYTPRS
jgi:hypothetical protein